MLVVRVYELFFYILLIVFHFAHRQIRNSCMFCVCQSFNKEATYLLILCFCFNDIVTSSHFSSHDLAQTGYPRVVVIVELSVDSQPEDRSVLFGREHTRIIILNG